METQSGVLHRDHEAPSREIIDNGAGQVVKDEHKHHEVFSHFRRWKGCVPLASMWIFSVVTTACPTSLRRPRNRLRALKHPILLPSTMNTLNGSVFSRQSYP